MRAASTESGEVAGYIAGGDTAMMPPPQVPYGQEFHQPQHSYSTPDPAVTQVTTVLQWATVELAVFTRLLSDLVKMLESFFS
jgi:hypothetical protein